MILGACWLLVCNAACVLGAHEILNSVRSGKDALDVLLFLLIRLTLISLTVLVAGIAQFLTPLALGICGCLVVSLLVARGAHRRIRRPRWPILSPWAVLFAALVGLRLLLQAWFFSPHVGDALAYHLPKIAEWVQSGGFTREMGLHPHVSFPAGFELIETWWVVFLHHDVLIELAGIEFLVVALSAVYVLAGIVGLGGGAAFSAALLYVTTPGFHLSATSCLNDAPAAALTVATFALCAARAPLPLILMTAGIGVGIKPTYGFALPGVALLAWFHRNETVPAKTACPPAWSVLLPAGGIAAGVFWYLRNALWFGNPFYPLGERDFVNPVEVQLGPRLTSFPQNLADLINQRMLDNLGAYGANVENISGWGPAAFSCGILALILGVVSHRRLRTLAASFLVSLCSVFLFVQNDAWCLKYVFFFPALLCVAAAQWGESRIGVARLTAAAMGLSFLATFVSYDLPLRDVAALAQQSWTDRSAAELCQAETTGEVVGCYGGFTADSYLLYGPDFSRRVVYLRSPTSLELMDAMKRHGLRTLYGARSSARQEAVLEECEQRGWLRRVAKNLYVTP